MLSRITILCFAGTYTLALLSDLARFVLGDRPRWYLTVGLTALGWLVQTVFLTNLAVQNHRLPISTVYESLLVLSWILAAIDLYLILNAPKPVAVGVFVLPVVLALIVAASRLKTPLDVEWAPWGGQVFFWGSVHGLLLVAGGVSTCVAFAAGLMYLAQARRLKLKRPPRLFALPSLEQSERLNRGAIIVAFPLLTFGLLIGLALDLAIRQSGDLVLAWNDPKVLSAGAMWLAFAVLLHARFRPAMRGRRMMVLTAVAFAFLVFTWVGVDLLHLPTAHGLARSAGRAP